MKSERKGGGSPERPGAILLGGEENAISVARSLGRRGVRVLGLVSSAESYVAHTRWAECVALGEADVQAGWLAWLMDQVSSGSAWVGSVLLPMSDEAVELLARNAKELEKHFFLPGGDAALHETLLDKARTLELAQKHGTPAPGHWNVSGPEELERVMDEVQFPCALKPVHSHLFQKRFGVKLIQVNDRRELRDALCRVLPSGLDVFVTEFIPGTDERCGAYYGYITEDGEFLFDFTKQSLRKKPIGSGYDTYQVSDSNDELVRAARQFFQAIGLTGIANVEFKKDPRDGFLKLMESNPRFTRSNELLIASGIDFPWLVYQRAVGDTDYRPDSYEKGVRLWAPLGDLLVFRELRRRGMLSWTAWIVSLCHSSRFQVFELGDPGPTLWALRSILVRRIRHSLGALRRAGNAVRQRLWASNID